MHGKAATQEGSVNFWNSLEDNFFYSLVRQGILFSVFARGRGYGGLLSYRIRLHLFVFCFCFFGLPSLHISYCIVISAHEKIYLIIPPTLLRSTISLVLHPNTVLVNQ